VVALAIDQSHPLVDLAFACATSDRWLRRKGMGYHSATTDLTAGAPHLAGQLQSPSLASSSTSSTAVFGATALASARSA
jgi:hypothetical protein